MAGGAQRLRLRPGYEFALATDEILLVDDGRSTVSLPEVPVLGELPATGGLIRLVDKRRVRPDLADVFCTRPDGAGGDQARAWGWSTVSSPTSAS